MIDVKDRIIQYPSRYQLVEVSTGIYDLVQVTGTITEEGTVINKAIFDSIHTDISNANVASYITFCANVNRTSLESAFGRWENSNISNIGVQLAMYAWFKGDSKTTYPFTNLITCNTLDEIRNNTSAFTELKANTNLVNLIKSCYYAYYKLTNVSDVIAINKKFSASDFTTTYTGSGYTYAIYENGLYMNTNKIVSSVTTTQTTVVNSGSSTHLICLGVMNQESKNFNELTYGYVGNEISMEQNTGEVITTLACPSNTNLYTKFKVNQTAINYACKIELEYVYFGKPI